MLINELISSIVILRISHQLTDFLISIGFRKIYFIFLAISQKSVFWIWVVAYCFTDSRDSFGEISLSFLISAKLTLILKTSFELSKYLVIKTIKIATTQTSIETARKGLKAKKIHEARSHQSAHSQEKILFLDRSSLYSEGSELFII